MCVCGGGGGACVHACVRACVCRYVCEVQLRHTDIIPNAQTTRSLGVWMNVCVCACVRACLLACLSVK